MRRRKDVAKLTALITLLVLVVAILVSTIVLSVVKRDFNANLQDPARIRIYNSETEDFYSYNYDNDSEEYKKIMKLWNDSFKENLFNLLFNGNLKSENYIENKNSQSNILTNVVEKNPDNFYLEFDYNVKRNLMINGEPYYRADNNEVVTYNKLMIEVNNKLRFGEITIYVEGTSQYTDTRSSSYQIITYGNLASLYTYIDSLIK